MVLCQPVDLVPKDSPWALERTCRMGRAANSFIVQVSTTNTTYSGFSCVHVAFKCFR